MQTRNFNNLPVALVAAGALALIPNANATTINDLTGGGSVTINNGIFSTTSFQTAGTGVIDPFVRIQNVGAEAGYNTSAGTPLNDKNSFNYDLLLSSLQLVKVGNQFYYDFRLDLNQSGNTSGDSKITLNQVEIFGLNSSAPSSGVGVDPVTGRATSANLLGTLLWDMNPNGDSANAVLLDFDLNKGGSGEGDMRLLVPSSALTGYTNIVFYSQFGQNPIPDGTASDAGFEEWDAVKGSNVGINPLGSPVPEPSTIVAGALLLLPFGAGAIRSLRKDRKS